MVHSTTTLQLQSIRLLLAISMMFGFKIWTSDVRQAYLQSAEPLSRNVFTSKPVSEFDLKPSECLQLLKPLYGFCESGDLWHQKVDLQHKTDLGMTLVLSDSALNTLMKDELMKGLSGGHVDDLLRACDKDFE